MTQHDAQAGRRADGAGRVNFCSGSGTSVVPVLALWALFTIGSISWVVLASLKTNRDVFPQPVQHPSDPQ